MRDAPILEVGIREVSAFCEFADFAYRRIDTSGGQPAPETYFYVHTFLCHCGMVGRLLWSSALAEHAAGKRIAEILKISGNYRAVNNAVFNLLDRYDLHLARGLSLRGDVSRIFDFNIGDRDAFEMDRSVFLRHYDPTVDTLTLMEEELNLAQIAVALADIRSRADAWLATNPSMVERAATVSIPPAGSGESPS